MQSENLLIDKNKNKNKNRIRKEYIYAHPKKNNHPKVVTLNQ